MATLLAEKNVYNIKTARSRPISLCVLSSLVRPTTLSLNRDVSVTSFLATNNIQVNSNPPPLPIYVSKSAVLRWVLNELTVLLLCSVHTSWSGLGYHYASIIWFCFVHTVTKHKHLFSCFEAVVSFSCVVDLTTDVSTCVEICVYIYTYHCSSTLLFTTGQH